MGNRALSRGKQALFLPARPGASLGAGRKKTPQQIVRSSAAVFNSLHQHPADSIRPSPVAACLVVLLGVVSVGIKNQIIHINVAPNPGPDAVHLILRHRHACRLLSVCFKKGIKKPSSAKQTMEERVFVTSRRESTHEIHPSETQGAAALDIIPKNHSRSTLLTWQFYIGNPFDRNVRQGIPFTVSLQN